jgi:hypothetical protein
MGEKEKRSPEKILKGKEEEEIKETFAGRQPGG